jgi:NAD(P)-dependent dehydrogenase (short-subunit alcohol dehydrogenase family)
MNQNGQVVVITGASAGVGRATANAFAREGARLCLIARDRNRLEATRQEVESLGGRAVICSADVADAEAVDEAAELAERTFGPIDVWVNNAMTSVFSPTWELTPEEVKRVTDVTYLGYVNGSLAALKRMRPRDSGVIVQVGSALAYRGIPLQAAYCGAKHAIEGFSDSLRTDLIHEGSKVRVISVHLPAMNTPQFEWVRSKLPNKPQPVPPIYNPDMAADAIVWASRHEKRELLVGWPTVMAVYGQRLLPGLTELYVAKTGWHSQQTPEPEDPDRPDNLYEPVPGDYTAHGRFGDKATMDSFQLMLAKNSRRISTAAVAGLALLGALRLLR